MQSDDLLDYNICADNNEITFDDYQFRIALRSAHLLFQCREFRAIPDSAGRAAAHRPQRLPNRLKPARNVIPEPLFRREIVQQPAVLDDRLEQRPARRRDLLTNQADGILSQFPPTVQAPENLFAAGISVFAGT